MDKVIIEFILIDKLKRDKLYWKIEQFLICREERKIITGRSIYKNTHTNINKNRCVYKRYNSEIDLNKYSLSLYDENLEKKKCTFYN